jgi:LemA protein
MVSVVAILAVVFALLLLAGLAWYVVSIYNRLVRVDERCENTWSDIDVALKQRQDLLEKLIDTARQAMDYERDVLQRLVEARESASRAETPAEHAEADAQVREALRGLNVDVDARSEAYPDIEAVDSLQRLQDEIARIEETIADRREYYNESVTSYNTIIRQFPDVVVATQLNYERRELFEAPEEELEDVDVSELFAGRDRGGRSGADPDPDAGAR